MPLTLKSFYMTDNRPFGANNKNVYVFSDGIFGGTDTSPRDNTILNYSTIYNSLYDRENGVLWLCTSNGVGYYDVNTNSVIIVNSGNIGAIDSGGIFLFVQDYIIYTGGGGYDRPVSIFDRNLKTYKYSFTGIYASYSGKNLNQTHYMNEYLIPTSAGNANTRVYDIRTGNVAFDIGSPGYHGVNNFGNILCIHCENGGNNFWMYDENNSSIRVFSGNNYGMAFLSVGDTGLITKTSPSDFEYDKIGVGGTRGNNNFYILNHDRTIYKQGSNASCIRTTFMKYNSTYSFGRGDGNGIWLYNKQTESFSNIDTGSGLCLVNISGSGNFCHFGAGIYALDGSTVYSNSNFITGFSRFLFNE